MLVRKPEYDDNKPVPEESWAEEVLEALPLQDNILTNQLIVDNVNEIKQPIMYEYISENEEDTQGVLSLNINGARVLSTYTNANSITTNGVHEFDVVDYNVNMPVMNYKVNVNVPQTPVYDPPSGYTAKRITSNITNTSLDYFINADLTNYQYVNKNIFVTIDVPSMPVLKYVCYGTNESSLGTKYTKTSFLVSQSDANITVSANQVLFILRLSGNNLVCSMYRNSTSSNITAYGYTGMYYKTFTNDSSKEIYLLDSNSNVLLKIDDVVGNDSNSYTVVLYSSLLDYNDFMT